MHDIAILANDDASNAQAILTALYCYKTLLMHTSTDKKPDISVASSMSYKNKSKDLSVTTITASQIDLLSSFGIEPESLITSCDGYIHYADKISSQISRSDENTSVYYSLANMGVAIQGVDFHHLLNLQRRPIQSKTSEKSSFDSSLSSYSLNALCQKQQKRLLPHKDLRDIRSSLKITLNVQSSLFIQLLLPVLEHSNISTYTISDWQLNRIKASDPSSPHGKLGYIESVSKDAIAADFFIDYRQRDVGSTSNAFEILTINTKQNQSTKLLEQGLELKDNHVTQIKRLGTRSIVAISSLIDDTESTSIDSTINPNPYPNERLWQGNVLDLSSLRHIESLAFTLTVAPSEYILNMWLSYFSSAVSAVPSGNRVNVLEDFANKQFNQALLNLRTFYLLPLYIHCPELLTQQLSVVSLGRKILTQLEQRTRLFLQKGSDYPCDFDLIPKEAWVNAYLSLHQWPQETDPVAYQIGDVQGILDKLKYRFEQALSA